MALHILKFSLAVALCLFWLAFWIALSFVVFGQKKRLENWYNFKWIKWYDLLLNLSVWSMKRQSDWIDRRRDHVLKLHLP